ncbi:hypothetical protein [Methanothermococcus thermolithotrophicus]|nr:hypothetical protein [Methanothermococcus thermolithotrophicus]
MVLLLGMAAYFLSKK